MTPFVVATCTPDYSLLAEEWQQSWKDVPDVTVTIVSYPDQGDWLRNTLVKPQVAEVEWLLETGGQEPLWLFDADTRVTGNHPLDPLLCSLLDADVAIHFHDRAKDTWRKKDQWCSAGCVGFAPTPLGRTALAWWAASCRSWRSMVDVRLPEQYLLWDAADLVRVNGGTVAEVDLRFNARPESFGHPFDLPDEDIAIAHYPASRARRKRG